MSAAERKLRGLKNRKRSIISSFSCITSFVNNFQAERDATEVPVRLENLNALWTEFNAVQAELETLEETEEVIEAYLQERTEFEKAYYRTKGTLLLHTRPSSEFQDAQRRPHEPSHQMTHVKLPDVKLPVFSGDFESWLNFHDLFLSLVHSSANLSTIQKFYYLRSSLAGEALKLIQTIPISNEQYPVAWKMLVDHFQNPRRLKRTYVQSLFEFACMKRESVSELHSLIERFEANVKILKQLGEGTEHWDVLLIHLLSTRLDPVTRRDWEEYAETNQTVKFSQLIEFLQRRVNVLQTVVGRSSEPQYQQQANSKKPNFQRSGNYGAVQQGPRGCLVCSGPHSLYQCSAFSKMAVDEKECVVRRNQLCRNCLRRGHMVKDCSSESSCRKCRGRHHTHLCTVSRSEGTSQSASIVQRDQGHSIQHTQSNSNEGDSSSAPMAHSGITSCTSQQRTSSKILLATAIIIVVDDNGNEYPVRALLDSGSECCFATERVSQRMSIRRSKVNLPIAGIGQSSTQVRYKFRSTLKSRITSFAAEVDMFVLPKVTVDLPCFSVDASTWVLPTGIQLADPSFHESGSIDVVVGAELFFELFNVAGRISLGESLPCLMNSVFGWVVSGKVGEATKRTSLVCNVATAADIHRDMERFWKIEEDSSLAISPQETLCEKMFAETVTRNADGRYLVRLPLKREILDNLDDNRRTAFHRFRLIERRLGRDPDLATDYRRFMTEYTGLGHMELISVKQAASQPSFFLPHHPVVRAESSTTKLRVVFDASCKSASGLSLNDAMLVGPIIQEDLRSIIMRSRLHPVMLIADITKMFRQIRLHPEDTPLQRIFWRSSPSEPTQVFELKTVTYGTASAPYLATRILKQLAEDEKQKFPLAAKATCEDFYVDDFISGAETIAEAIELRKQMQTMFSSAGMELRKWASNYPAVLEGVSEANLALQQSVDFDKDQSIKTLGLHWEPQTDRLKYLIQGHQQDPTVTVTKRSALSYIAKLFDPLGLVGPVIVTAKIFMQALWSLKEKDGKPLDWDQELPETMKVRWNSYYSELPRLNELRINRLVMLPRTISVELHFFSDASEEAYGCCVYVRSTNSSCEIMVALLTSRSKVAPLKQQSIPRLELCGALQSAELYVKVKKALRVTVTAYFWVDSTIVLCWLGSTPSTWSTFVGNRVSKIQHATPDCEWNHVAGHENPADIISRGHSPSELVHSKLWWEGPPWLKQGKESWPVQVSENFTSPEVAKEVRKTSLTAAVQKSTSFVDEYIAKFSGYQRMLRITAYWRRYFTFLRLSKAERTVSSPLTTTELRTAELTLVRLVQEESFPEEWKALHQNKRTSKTSRLRWFHPMIATDGVIRIGGRLGQSAQSYETKHQMILPKTHDLTKLLIRCYHERYLHAAVQMLTNTLRLRFWILGGRSVTRDVVHACVTCCRAKPKLVEQFMSELPSHRVTASRPFSIVGIDFWGPIYLQPRHRRDAPPKAYVAVFVCFCTKAVHLELVVNLSTAKFLQAFRRFVSRRGLCSDVYTDNGTNFVGAANELRKLMQSEDFRQSVAREFSEHGIRWHFNPPRGSHFGGLWEAAIKSAQKHFIRVLGDRKLAFDDMETLLNQIECCLNSRPLTKITDDPSDLEPLTPGHFLVGTALQSVPDTNYANIPYNRLQQWQQTQKVFQDIWKRWHIEYLATLQPRTKWCNPPVELEIGQLVVIMDENQPPMSWPMGRIIELHPGKDGVVRVVTLRTAASKPLTRPVAKICLLPIPPSTETDLQ